MVEIIGGKSSEASQGGFQAIVEIEGLLQPIERVAPKFTETQDGKPAKDQAKIVLEDALILKMEEGEAEPELTNDTFTMWMGFAAPGKVKPHANSLFVKGFMKGAEVLDAKRRGVPAEEGDMSNLYGTRVKLQKQMVHLFTRKDKETGQETDVEYAGMVPVECDDADTTNLEEHIKALIVGKTQPLAKKAVIMDNKARRYPEYKNAIETGEIEEMLGVKLVDGKYQEVSPA